jgi:hypothetical protein
VIYWKEKYEIEVKERNLEFQERHQNTMKGVANALMFALSVEDDKDGNLIISKENKKLY